MARDPTWLVQESGRYAALNPAQADYMSHISARI